MKLSDQFRDLISGYEEDRGEDARLTEWATQAEALEGRVAALEAALRRIANADGSYPDKRIIDDMVYCALSALGSTASETFAKCPICGSHYAPLARCACGKNPPTSSDGAKHG